MSCSGNVPPITELGLKKNQNLLRGQDSAWQLQIINTWQDLEKVACIGHACRRLMPRCRCYSLRRKLAPRPQSLGLPQPDDFHLVAVELSGYDSANLRRSLFGNSAIRISRRFSIPVSVTYNGSRNDEQPPKKSEYPIVQSSVCSEKPVRWDLQENDPQKPSEIAVPGAGV